MVKVIKIRFTEKTAKTGNKFLIAKAQKLDGSWTPIKFTKEVDIPKKQGLYNMTIDTENMNKSYNDYGEVWWANKAEEFTEYVRPDEAIDEF